MEFWVKFRPLHNCRNYSHFVQNSIWLHIFLWVYDILGLIHMTFTKDIWITSKFNFQVKCFLLCQAQIEPHSTPSKTVELLPNSSKVGFFWRNCTFPIWFKVKSISTWERYDSALCHGDAVVLYFIKLFLIQSYAQLFKDFTHTSEIAHNVISSLNTRSFGVQFCHMYINTMNELKSLCQTSTLVFDFKVWK